MKSVTILAALAVLGTVRAQCPDVPAIANAQVKVDDTTATYTCDDGFAQQGTTNVATCKDKVWATIDLKCTDVSTCSVKEGGAIIYSGTKAETQQGHKCKAWDEQTSYKDSYFKPAAGENTDPTRAKSVNYCRDPSGGTTKAYGQLWCYVEGGSPKWDVCDGIPDCAAVAAAAAAEAAAAAAAVAEAAAAAECGDPPALDNTDVKAEGTTATYTCKKGFAPRTAETAISTCKDKAWSTATLDCVDVSTCYFLKNGIAIYSGTEATAKGGLPCQAWDKTKPQKHSYKDDSFKQAAGYDPTPTRAESVNYCRDPSGGTTRPAGFLWCYVDQRRPRWARCDNVKECA